MRPSHLKMPPIWKEAKVALIDRVLFIPPRCKLFHDFVFPGWEHSDIFGNTNPVNLEYCSGNGVWIAEKALTYPQQNWVAVEKKFDRVRKIWSKIKNYQLNNLLVVCGEGLVATHRYFPQNSINETYVNFPDPWPKTRHLKNRIMQPVFINEVARVLKKEGDFIFVTDDAPYSDWTLKLMQEQSSFTCTYEAPYYLIEDETYGTSSFQKLWKAQGRVIRYHRFKKS